MCSIGVKLVERSALAAHDFHDAAQKRDLPKSHLLPGDRERHIPAPIPKAYPFKPDDIRFVATSIDTLSSTPVIDLPNWFRNLYPRFCNFRLDDQQTPSPLRPRPPASDTAIAPCILDVSDRPKDFAAQRARQSRRIARWRSQSPREKRQHQLLSLSRMRESSDRMCPT